MKKDAKNPSKLKTGLEGALGHNNTVRQNSVFLYGGLINTIRKIGTPRHSRGFFICGQSPLLLATPQGVGTVCHLRKISACYP